MSVEGFKVNGTVHKYEYDALEDAPTPITLDATLTRSDAAAPADKVGELKSDLDGNTYEFVEQDGVGQVKTKNIFGAEELNRTVPSNNIVNTASLVESGVYVGGIHPDTGKGYLLPNANYDTYIIPVDGESVYNFTMCRTALVITDLSYSPVGELLVNTAQISSTGGKYILFSIAVATYPISNYVITTQVKAYKMPSNWIIPKDTKAPFAETHGDVLATNAYISLPINACVRKNGILVFRARIGSLGNFEIGFTTAANDSGTKYNRFVITSTAVIAYTSYNYNTQAMNSETIEYGMQIVSGELQIIVEETETGTCKLTIFNNTKQFTHEFSGWVKNNTLIPYCKAAWGSFANYKFTWSCVDLKKPLWLFGDSYMSYAEDRWPYYLEAYGYAKNVLINAFPGCWSAAAVSGAASLLTVGTPNKAVWALGMNDGSDSDTTPSSAWVTGRDNFLSYCKANDIEPIFATIPTVPSVNNEQKNAWVRSSGYRYIDFAMAVNASSSGAWDSGLLSSDGIHPTAAGARALFSEALLDFPEIMVEQ